MRGDQHTKRLGISLLGGGETRIGCGQGDHGGLFTPSPD
jgi:hypothetical protein